MTYYTTSKKTTFKCIKNARKQFFLKTTYFNNFAQEKSYLFVQESATKTKSLLKGPKSCKKITFVDYTVLHTGFNRPKYNTDECQVWCKGFQNGFNPFTLILQKCGSILVKNYFNGTAALCCCWFCCFWKQSFRDVLQNLSS